eukprot:COSAG01_NODE_14205_length_1483_cov_1.572254_2_plen_81_part_01
MSEPDDPDLMAEPEAEAEPEEWFATTYSQFIVEIKKHLGDVENGIPPDIYQLKTLIQQQYGAGSIYNINKELGIKGLRLKC